MLEICEEQAIKEILADQIQAAMSKDKKKLKKFPSLKTDEEARKFVAEADLSEYDFSDFQPVEFEFTKKSLKELSISEERLKELEQRTDDPIDFSDIPKIDGCS